MSCQLVLSVAINQVKFVPSDLNDVTETPPMVTVLCYTCNINVKDREQLSDALCCV